MCVATSWTCTIYKSLICLNIILLGFLLNFITSLIFECSMIIGYFLTLLCN